jgi:3-deoxy-D-manno-octulosonic-acid transferase
MRLTARQRFVLILYQLVLGVGVPVGILLSSPWLLAKVKRRHTVFQRLGFQRFNLPHNGPRPVWIHALSLGETLSCETLVKNLRKRLTDRPLVLSVSTLAGRQIAEQRLAGYVDRIFYFPLDWAPSVWRALWSVRPILFVLVETDIWPGFLHALRVRRIPAVLVNARLSPQTLRSYLRFRELFTPALNVFDMICPQSKNEASRYLEVGVNPEKIGPIGNLKFDAAVQDLSPQNRQRILKKCGIGRDDLVWIAGSTHMGEEEIVFEVFNRIREKHPQLRLILVPRHPHRSQEVKALCHSFNLRARLLTEAPSAATGEVLIVDVMGQLATLYHLASIAFIGGSLVPKGGQNPIEPAAAARPVLFGPYMSDFPDMTDELLSRHAAFQVHHPDQLFERLMQLLSDPDRALRMGLQGHAFVKSHSGTTQRIIGHLLSRLPSAKN